MSCIFQTKLFNILHLIIIFQLYITTTTHNTNIINVPAPIYAQGIIKRLIPLDVSSHVQTIHSAKTKIEEDLKYIVVQPAQVHIWNAFLHRPLQLPSNMPSLLQELRSHRTSNYRAMVVVDQHIFLYLAPNKIVIVKEKQHPIIKIFEIENSYVLDGIQDQDEVKIYHLKNKNEIAALLTVKNSKYIYKLGIKQSQKLQLQKPVNIGYLQFVHDNIFVGALQSNGVCFIKILPNSLQTLKNYSCEQLFITHQKSISKQQQISISADNSTKQQSSCIINDLVFDNVLSKLYLLDKKTGLYEYDYKYASQYENKPDVSLKNINKILPISNCDALDSVSSEHFILICESNSPNPYIQEIMKLPDPLEKNKMVYVKKQPIYHSCSFNDLIVTQDFFMAFDSYAIDVFWSGSNTNSMLTEHSKQHFNLPGLQIFALYRVPHSKQMYLYVVESNILIKYHLSITKGSIYAYSNIPVTKQITLQVPGLCDNQSSHSLTLNKQLNKNTQCIYEYKVNLDIQLKIQPISRQKVSMSIGVIILMLAVLIILIWICLVKYRGLEGHARKMLQKYRQRNRYQDNKFTI